MSFAAAIFLTGCENDVKSISRSVAYSNAVSKVEAVEVELIALRHDLHRNPEVSGKEIRTSAKVAEKLTSLGFEVQENVGGYGVVGVLQTGRSGPVVAFRADMDATAQDNNDDVSYASQVEGVYHICGHDMHTTIGIALAEALSHVKDDLSGTVMLIFQPEEEARHQKAGKF